MATIRNRGEYQWEAQIRRKGYPAQRKTFETKANAQAWAHMIESEIDRGMFVSRVEAERTAFYQLIDQYISETALKHKGAYSEIKRPEALKRRPLATRIVATLTSSDFALYRDERLNTHKGNTAKRELALFQCVMRSPAASGEFISLRTRCVWSAALATTTNARDAWTRLRSSTSEALWSFGSAVQMAPIQMLRTILGYGRSFNWRLKPLCAAARFSSCDGGM